MRPKSAARAIVRRARAAGMSLGPSAVILAYHRVAEPAIDPQLLCVAPERFDAQLKVIADLGVPLSLRELVRRAAVGRLPDRAVVVTFDDGYADNLHAAEPLLRNAGVPATVFVTTGGLETGQPFWWDHLEALLLRSSPAPRRLVVTTGRREFAWDLGDDGSSDARGHALVGRHAGARSYAAPCRLPDAGTAVSLPPPMERDRVIGQVARQCAPPDTLEDCRRLRPDEIGRLADSDVIEVGAHGVWHAPLSVLTPEDQRNELWRGKESLAQFSGAPVDLLSYPFGAAGDLTQSSVALAHDCGFMAACANWPDRVSSLTDPYRLPRFLVRDWGAERFAQSLGSWLSGRPGDARRQGPGTRRAGI